MSKKFLVTSLAALSLSIFAGPSVLAETGVAVVEPTAGETGSQDNGLEQLLEAAQSLETKLSTLFSSDEPLPVSPENDVFLMDTLAEINALLEQLQAYQADSDVLQPLVDLRKAVLKLYLLQYEAPKLFESLLTQVPTLADKRYDDAVDFHDFDAELDKLLADASYLGQILAYVEEDLDPEELSKDRAYLSDVVAYLLSLQEELYAPEGETVDVPEAPVYWNEAAVPVIDSEAGSNDGATDTETGSAESTEESGDQGSTESGTDTVTEPSSETTDTGSIESTEESSDQGSTDTGTGEKTPSDVADTGSTETTEETGDQGTRNSSEESGNQQSSAKEGQGSGQTPPPANVPGSTQSNQKPGQEKGGQGQSNQTPSSTNQSTESAATVATSQTKAVLPTTGDATNEFYLLAGLFLASLGLASMKRRKA